MGIQYSKILDFQNVENSNFLEYSLASTQIDYKPHSYPKTEPILLELFPNSYQTINLRHMDNFAILTILNGVSNMNRFECQNGQAKINVSV